MTTISRPMTTEIPTTINAGRLNPREAIGAESGALLDIPQPLQSLLDEFFRGRPALAGRQYLIHFFFERVHHEFVDRRVTAGLGTLLHLVEQFAFNLDFVGTEHLSPYSLITARRGQTETPIVQSYLALWRFQIPAESLEQCQ